MPPLTKPEMGLAGCGRARSRPGSARWAWSSSFEAVSAAAARWGFATPWMLPVGIDVAIPVFTAANLLLIRMDMALAWVRFVPWVLTLITCGLNVAAGHALWAKVAHGTMPLLWVVFSEIGAHIYAVRIGAATGRRMEKIRFSRWLLAFPSTFALWRRMTLWEVTSYTEALAREKERQLARADLRERLRPAAGARRPRGASACCSSSANWPRRRAGTARPHRPDAAGAIEAPSRARARAPAKGKAKAQRTVEELLTEAREATADWADARADRGPIRTTLHCSAANARSCGTR